MNRYSIELTKTGYMKYISHLDLVRLFRNAFKKAGIKLVYSQGFNPHPKMSFAQPLSLGYSSTCEVLEFETENDYFPEEITDSMNSIIPDGLLINRCNKITAGKSFAARLYAAAYDITFPSGNQPFAGIQKLCESFLMQKSIIALKREKKAGTKRELDIRGMIRELSAETAGSNIILHAVLDSGSASNLSPELLISSFVSFAGMDTEREDVEVKRVKMFFE